MENIDTWVSDKLIDILGYTDKTVVGFIVSIAKKHKEPKSFLEALKTCDVPINPSTELFARDLLAKMPKTAPTGPTFTQQMKTQEKKTVDFLKKNDSYKLVLDDPEPEEKSKSSKSEKSSEIDSKKRKIRSKEKSAVEEQEEEDRLKAAEKKAKVEETDEEKYER